MSLHYIIDGYNVMKKLPECMGRLNIRKRNFSREEFIKFIKKIRPQGSFKNRTTIVFDGVASKDSLEDEVLYGVDKKFEVENNIEIIFTKGESADTMIKRLVENSISPAGIMVVTDDREIKEYVRLNNAKTVSVSEFIEPVLRKRFYSNLMPEEKKIKEEDIKKINTELEKIWIKRSKNR